MFRTFYNRKGFPNPASYYAMKNYEKNNEERDSKEIEMKTWWAEKMARKSKPAPDRSHHQQCCTTYWISMSDHPGTAVFLPKPDASSSKSFSVTCRHRTIQKENNHDDQYSVL